MEGTVLITGANGSLAIPAIDQILSKYPSYTVIATVRNDTKSDANTTRLLSTIAKYPNAKYQLRKLDLSRFSEVAAFAAELHSDIAKARVPVLSSIICNAMAWSLEDGIKLTPDGIETSLAINHLAQFDLVLRLLGDLKDAKDGRVIFLGSEAHHDTGLGGLKPELPSDLEHLAHPPPDKKGEESSKGFQRYGVSKLVIIMTAFELERRLKENPDLRNISVLTVDPGGLVDSRVFAQNDVPRLWSILMKIFTWFQPLVNLLLPQIRLAATAAADVVDYALNPVHAGKSGYYIMNKAGPTSAASQDEKVQRELWKKSVEWCGLEQKDTAVPL